MIQIIGYRHEYFAKIGASKTVSKFHDKEWRAESVPEIYKNIDIILGRIPQSERFNLHYTVAKCTEKERDFHIQTTIPFDIDGIDKDKIEQYHNPILAVLGGLPYDEVGICCSGNGLHYIIETDVGITDPEYFTYTRHHYRYLCDQINIILEENNLPGTCDPDIWAKSQTLRLPNTENRKTANEGYKNKNKITSSYIIQPNIKIQKDLTIESMANVPVMAEDNPGQFTEQDQIASYPAPDSTAVMQECEFLKWARENQAEVSEPQWVAMLTITSRLEDGVTLSHACSNKHPEYNERSCGIKISHALQSYGPRTCHNINSMWDGCHNCAHFGKVVSPINIQGPDYIKTETTGFWNMVLDEKTGMMKAVTPNFKDLVKAYNREHDFITDDDEQIYIWNGKHWDMAKTIHPKRFIEEKMDPDPSAHHVHEFLQKLYRSHGKPNEFLEHSVAGKINMQNGILDLTGEKPVLLEHSKEYGFLSVTNYGYDPSADCPRFKQFMSEITRNDKPLQNLLLEFIAYGLTDVDCVEQKAMILLGEGANGKSTFLDVVKELIGPKAYSILNLEQFKNEQQVASLRGKLFNISEETPKDSFVESSYFKNAVSGGELSAKVVYKEPMLVKNRAKIMVAANTMPQNRDNTHGMWRRFLIAPFNYIIPPANRDKYLTRKLFAEMPGIVNLIIEANTRYRTHGFTDSKAVEDVLNEYRTENTLDEFFLDHIQMTSDETSFLTANTLYDKYLHYCEREHNKFPLSKVNMSRGVKSFLQDRYKVDASLMETRQRVNGVRQRGWKFCELVKTSREAF